MNQEHQIQIESQRILQHEDEIELIDILRVIWKWKYFILSGTIACGLIVAIISFNMPKVYSVDMVLRPGVLSIGEKGEKIYTDSPSNIRALINSGAFNDKILEYLKNNHADHIPKKLQFKVTVPEESDTIKVQYETSDIKQGIELQNRLFELLLETKAELIKKSILSGNRNVENIEKRIIDLNTEIELIKNNTANLIEERKKFISTSQKGNNVLSTLVYSNTIQQNLELLNNYQNQINKYEAIKEKELQRISHIKNIQLLQSPVSSSIPIKPKTPLNTILAMMVGFFFFFFLSFFLEYLKRHKST